MNPTTKTQRLCQHCGQPTNPITCPTCGTIQSNDGQQVQAIIDELTGDMGANLEEALNQWTAEHELVKDLNQNYDLLRIQGAQMIKALRLADIAMQQLKKDGLLLLSQKTRDKLENFTYELERLKELLPELSEPPF